MDSIQKDIDAAAAKKAKFSDLFTNRANKKALIIALALMTFQQLSGINAVIFYSNNIFESAGSNLDPTISAIIIGVVQVIATFVSILLVDKAGRRILLLLSDFIMGVSLCVLGVYFFMKSTTDVSGIGFLPLLSVVVFIVMFSLGFGPIPWMMVGELFAPEVKGIAASLAVALNWTLAFLVTLSFGFVSRMIGTAAVFLTFAVVCFVGTVFIFFVVPETKGKTLGQIQKELAGEK